MTTSAQPRPLREVPAPSRNKRRLPFLLVSAAATLAVLIWAREVLFPFVLALVLAYVLTPAVRRVERLRVPRWGAVVAVYIVTLGTLYAAVATIAPRIGTEMQGLVREAPALAAQIKSQLPALRRMLSRATGTSARGTEPSARGTELDESSAAPPNGETAPQVETGAARPQVETGAARPPMALEPAAGGAGASGRPAPLRIVQKADGVYEVELGPGIDLQQVSQGHWRVEMAEPADARPFEPERFLEDALAKAVAYGQRNTFEVIRLGHSIIRAVSRTIFLFFMTLMLAAYIMMTRERIIDFFRSLVRREGRGSFDLLLARVDRGLAGVVRGQLIICMMNGVLSAIGFRLFELKHWPILALVAAVMSLIPIFGSILSSIPIVAIALTQSLGTALWVLLWIIGIHQLEANVLNPKIIGDAAKIHPVLVVFSLLAGEHFFGLAGALLAVPVMSIAQSLFLHFRQLALADDPPPDSFVPPAPTPEGSAEPAA